MANEGKSAGSQAAATRPMKTTQRVGRVALAALVIAAIVGPCVWVLTDPDFGKSGRATRTAKSSARLAESGPAGQSDARVPPIGGDFIDDSGNALAFRHPAPIADRSSLRQCYEAAAGRARRGIADFQAQLEQLDQDQPRPPDYDDRRARLQTFIGLLNMYEGRFSEASSWFERAVTENRASPARVACQYPGAPGRRRAPAGRDRELRGLPGAFELHLSDLPGGRPSAHRGSREAVRWFTEYLKERPADLGVRWLLNIAYMTLGDYPEKVPADFLIPPDAYRSKLDTGRFLNVAPLVGLDSRGPNMLGGSVFDDFTGDGRPDILVLSGDWDLGGSLFVNRGDGRFEDRGTSAGLADQRLSVNLAHADFDNDGDLDVLALRGGWETPYRLSLLRNKGDGVFDDVTVSAGLGEPIASQSAAWGDYDNDGLLDLYVAGEYDLRQVATPLNLCRLYRNRGDGTFENVAEKAGVLNAGFAKGVAWGDYDDDGDLDLYVSNMMGPNRLDRNNGDGTFTDVAPELGVTEPFDSFSCWFWDYDNDGRLDLFVAGFSRVAPGHRGRHARPARPGGAPAPVSKRGAGRV